MIRLLFLLVWAMLKLIVRFVPQMIRFYALLLVSFWITRHAYGILVLDPCYTAMHSVFLWFGVSTIPEIKNDLRAHLRTAGVDLTAPEEDRWLSPYMLFLVVLGLGFMVWNRYLFSWVGLDSDLYAQILPLSGIYFSYRELIRRLDRAALRPLMHKELNK